MIFALKHELLRMLAEMDETEVAGLHCFALLYGQYDTELRDVSLYSIGHAVVVRFPTPKHPHLWFFLRDVQTGDDTDSIPCYLHSEGDPIPDAKEYFTFPELLDKLEEAA